MSEPTKDTPHWRCSKCSGKNICWLDWVDPNTDKVLGDYENADPYKDYWCNDCEEHLPFDFVSPWDNL